MGGGGQQRTYAPEPPPPPPPRQAKGPGSGVAARRGNRGVASATEINTFAQGSLLGAINDENVGKKKALGL